MSKSANQKLKLLYLARLFAERTDEEHTLTMSQLIEALADYGIQAERKSIYDDMDALRLFGLDIKSRRTKYTGYYMANNRLKDSRMLSGSDSVVFFRFEDGHAHELTERFGDDIMLMPVGDGYVETAIPVRIDEHFYSWLFGLGTAVEIIGPREVAEEYRQRLLAVANVYE